MVRRVQWARARGQTVTGDGSATRYGGRAYGTSTETTLGGTGGSVRVRVGLLGTPGAQL